MTVVDIGLVMCHDEDRTAGLQPFGGAAQDPALVLVGNLQIRQEKPGPPVLWGGSGRRH